MPDDRYAAARAAIDAAHREDPAGAESAYADAMAAWVQRVDPAASPLLVLAARCQHLQRWTVPRASFPLGKPGYLAWRRHLYTVQADLARRLLSEAGVPADEAEQVWTWVAKRDLQSNAGTQALEDAACLVFLEREIAGFAAAHADYPEAKFIDILQKTWRKMSPAGHALALALPLPPTIAALVRKALGG